MQSSGRPGRRERPVSVGEIAATALALIDADGLESLTMRGLATAIGVQPMTLYRYLPNKQAILAEVADLLWRELGPIDPAITGWRERVKAMWLQLFDLMLRHPHAVPVIARGGSYSATAGADTAGMLGELKGAGFTPETAGEFIHTASALIVGFAFAQLWQQEVDSGLGPATPAGEAPAPDAELLEFARSLPSFTTGEFGRALELLIDGFEGRLRQQPGVLEA
ncbi:MAG: TetR/AcrR family transcriptional regulator [Propionibacteriaceae bacterium]|nr:TetR/AcrR family transcriptional regulator [Propionibacteriaceae bacterium]